MGFFGLRIWDIDAGREVLRLPHDEGIRLVHFSSDGDWLAATDYGWKSLLLWDRRDGYQASELTRLRGQDMFEQIAFGPNDRRLTARSRENLAVWDLDERIVVSRLEGGRLGEFTFSPDGQLIAVKTDGGAVVWDWKSDQLLARIEDVDEMRFTPDSRRLVVVHDDDQVRVWQVAADDLIAEACSRLERNLTSEEWRTHRGDAPYRRSCENLPKPGR
jgi:WD40 repeat protein